MLNSLIISSDEQLVWTVRPLLGQLEFAVTVKPTLADGLDSLWRTRYNALLVDCEQGGREGLRAARLAPLNRESVVIAITGRTQHDSEDLAEAGADAVWRRPLVASQMLQTLVAARGIATGDRRLYNRQQLERAAFLRYSYNGSEFFQSVIVDVNETGMAIEALEPLTIGRAMQVEFALPAMMSPIQALAEVVWRNPDGRAGLRFLQMPESGERQLDRWLRSTRLGMRSTCSSVS